MSDSAIPVQNTYGEPTVEEMSKTPTLLDNSKNGGHLPYQQRTTSYPKKPLYTIGTRGQERGEA